MNIIFSTDNKGACYALVAMYSVLKNNKSKFTFHILYTELNKEYKNAFTVLSSMYGSIVKLVKIDDSIYVDMDIKNRNVPIQGYFRYFAPLLLNSENKALYLDIDTLCLGDLSNLYSTNIVDSYFGWALDGMIFRNPNSIALRLGFNEVTKPYCNSGVILMNLSKMRHENITNLFIDNVRNRKKIIPNKYDIFNDQTIANITYNKSIILHQKFNTLLKVVDIINLDYDPVIVHFSGRHKPLTYYNDKTVKYMDIYYQYTKAVEQIIGMDILKNIIKLAGHRSTSYIT